MRLMPCRECGKTYEGDSCPRCALIDAVVPAPLAPPASIVIPGPPSSLLNSLSATQPPEIERFAALPPNRIDEIARRVEPSSRPAHDEIDCPRCAERIKIRAKVCRYCGHEFDDEGDERPRARRRGSSDRLEIVREVHHHYRSNLSPSLAAVLSFFWAGLGQLYCGHVLRGFAFMFTNFGIVAIAFALVASGSIQGGYLFGCGLGLVVWMVGIVDAYNLAAGDGEPVDYRGRRRR